jgi:hypothetical protein
MLPITRTRKFRISNRLAGIAALLLVVTSLAGLGGPTQSSGGESAHHTTPLLAEDAPALLYSGGASKVKSNKGFKMSLFLFRNH